jgi:flavin-dependent dehydrogenase
MPKLLGPHAIVVGAGIGGLVAAKALSAYFGMVTVLERDALPSEPTARTGTPQARQIHVLLRGGLDALIEFNDLSIGLPSSTWLIVKVNGALISRHHGFRISITM